MHREISAAFLFTLWLWTAQTTGLCSGSLAGEPQQTETTAALRERGARLLQSGDFQAAIPVYRELTVRQPGAYEGYLVLGYCYARTSTDKP